MARAETKTWLPLDRFAEIIGVNPLHFNQLSSSAFPDTCGVPWFQYAWQDADRVGREAVAIAIREAEKRIARYIGYNLLPDWTEEYVQYPQPVSPELFGTIYNPRWARKSLELRKGHVISGGVKVTSLIEAGVAIVRSDVDGDTYEEKCTVTVTTDVADCEIHVFYPGESGASEWEIRPIEVSSAGGVATITFKSWQIVDPDKQASLSPGSLTAETDTNYITTVDVYRVYNDPQTQATLMWENLPIDDCYLTGDQVCQWSTQTGCLQIRNNRLGFATVAPATWDSDNEKFDGVASALARSPDKVLVNYYSGYKDRELTCPTIKMDDMLEKAIAYFAATLIDRDVCACNNVQNYVDYWREDLARLGTDRSFQVSQMHLGNPFGTMRGAIFAYNICNDDGRKLGR